MMITVLITAIVAVMTIALNNRFRVWKRSVVGFLFFVAFLMGIFPDATSAVANFLGVGRGADLLFFISIAILFLLVFIIYTKLVSFDRKYTKLARVIALRDAIDNRGNCD